MKGWLVMGKVLAIKIEAETEPKIVYIDDDLHLLSRNINIDKYGNKWPDFEVPTIMTIEKNIKIVSCPDGEQRGLSLVRWILNRNMKTLEFYGVVYIVKTLKNRGFELTSLTDEEADKYIMKFYNTLVTKDFLYENDDYEEDLKYAYPSIKKYLADDRV